MRRISTLIARERTRQCQNVLGEVEVKSIFDDRNLGRWMVSRLYIHRWDSYYERVENKLWEKGTSFESLVPDKFVRRSKKVPNLLLYPYTISRLSELVFQFYLHRVTLDERHKIPLFACSKLQTLWQRSSLRVYSIPRPFQCRTEYFSRLFVLHIWFLSRKWRVLSAKWISPLFSQVEFGF